MYTPLSGLLAFVTGWAVVAVLASDGAFSNVPKWQSSLWLYLVGHGIRLCDIHLGGIGFSSTQPLSTMNDSMRLRYVPLVAVTGAALYTYAKFFSPKIKRSVSKTIGAD